MAVRCRDSSLVDVHALIRGERDSPKLKSRAGGGENGRVS